MAPPVIYHSNLPPIPAVNESVFTYLFRTANSYPPTRPAFIDATNGNSISRGELKALSLALAYGLRNNVVFQGSTPRERSTLNRGDVIMIFSPNSLSWPVALFGAVAAGLRITLASSSLTPRELSWQWVDSRARIIAVAPTHLTTAKEMFKLLGIGEEEANSRIWIMDDLWKKNGKRAKGNANHNWLGSLLTCGSLTEEERFDGKDSEETLYICYSSGTTGRPKGVESSHKGAGSVISMAWSLFKSIQTKNDVTLALLPFYHIFGLVGHLHHSFYIGAPTVILTQGFEPIAFCKTVQQYKITMAMIVPPILLTLTQHPAVAKYDLRSLTALISGGAPLSPALVTNFSQKMKDCGANPVIIQGYGSTETTLTVMTLSPEDWSRKFGSVGRLAPNLEVRLVKEVDQAGEVVDVGEGEPGELWIKGPTIMKGYLHNDSATISSFQDGWYKTGDILRRESDGYFYVVDRQKEMIKYKGLQVAPAELEAILLENLRIQDVGVIGIRDAYSGNELPRAYVVPAEASILRSPSEKAEFERHVETWIRGKVAHYKELRGGVVAVEAIPKSPTGKILRRELRELAKKAGETSPRVASRL